MGIDAGKFSWKLGFCGRGCVCGWGMSTIDASGPTIGTGSGWPGGTSTPAGNGILNVCGAGGRRTTGLASAWGAGREMMDPVGEKTASLSCMTMDDRLLTAALGE
jgi:hypothetical protein